MKGKRLLKTVLSTLLASIAVIPLVAVPLSLINPYIAFFGYIAATVGVGILYYKVLGEEEKEKNEADEEEGGKKDNLKRKKTKGENQKRQEMEENKREFFALQRQKKKDLRDFKPFNSPNNNKKRIKRIPF